MPLIVTLDPFSNNLIYHSAWDLAAQGAAMIGGARRIQHAWTASLRWLTTARLAKRVIKANLTSEHAKTLSLDGLLKMWDDPVGVNAAKACLRRFLWLCSMRKGGPPTFWLTTPKTLNLIASFAFVFRPDGAADARFVLEKQVRDAGAAFLETFERLLEASQRKGEPIPPAFTQDFSARITEYFTPFNAWKLPVGPLRVTRMRTSFA